MTYTDGGQTLKEFRAVCPVSKFMVTRVYSRATAGNAKRFLMDLLGALPFPLLSVQVDGGSEFMAGFEDACEERRVPLHVLPPRRPQWNGCVERTNRSARIEFLEPLRRSADRGGRRSRPCPLRVLFQLRASAHIARLSDPERVPCRPGGCLVPSAKGIEPAQGLAAELWTLSALAAYLRREAEATGFPRLSRVSKTSVWRILREHDLKPHRVRYYLERRDPEFDREMREVLMVYRDVFLTPASARDPAAPAVHTVSVDEKPRVQAIGTTAPDLPPEAGEQATMSRDYEYVRHGTLSILAALDLHTGEVIADRRAETSQQGVHRLAGALASSLSPRGGRPRRPRQPLRAHLPRDHGVPGDAPRTVRIRSYAETRFLAEPDRVRLLEDGAHLPAPHPRRFHRGTEIPHPPRHRGNERRTRAGPLAELRSGHRMKCQLFRETNY